ncbi:hypothetical protein GGS23DRAFT_358036 [Durotheca rogersii]|uniref:uncharacterized protein n=1 Tax=Durotheca rogersii TaxID=419775 RepID=UPI00221E755A|nr:uncharacterized protein GGS23DRAFT_358036 [Durotheca rogersii]KAI5865878.1 hypothetical protein GGS23DRAFT_358036 [Durotheca rogersii]
MPRHLPSLPMRRRAELAISGHWHTTEATRATRWAEGRNDATLLRWQREGREKDKEGRKKRRVAMLRELLARADETRHMPPAGIPMSRSSQEKSRDTDMVGCWMAEVHIAIGLLDGLSSCCVSSPRGTAHLHPTHSDFPNQLCPCPTALVLPVDGISTAFLKFFIDVSAHSHLPPTSPPTLTTIAVVGITKGQRREGQRGGQNGAHDGL